MRKPDFRVRAGGAISRAAGRRKRPGAGRLRFELLENRLALSSNPIAPMSASFSGPQFVSPEAVPERAPQVVANGLPNVSPLPNQIVEPGQTLSFQVTASGGRPNEPLTYSLDPGAPTGAAIDARGQFTWPVPSSASQNREFEITVRVTAGTPPSSATREFDVDVGNNPVDALFTTRRPESFDPDGRAAATGAALQSLLTTVPTPLSPLVRFPLDRYQEAPTHNGLSGVFTETGLPHTYEDEQLLARNKAIHHKKLDKPSDDTLPAVPSPNGASSPAPGKRPDQGHPIAWHTTEDERPTPAEIQAPTDDDELLSLLAVNSLETRLVGPAAADHTLIDAAFAADETTWALIVGLPNHMTT
ncbi:MAG TPA: hypothetical protein VMV69_26025 [Pirellulales bacterium]|nr:hypothetical protein [Pirellulales bacterium]